MKLHPLLSVFIVWMFLCAVLSKPPKPTKPKTTKTTKTTTSAATTTTSKPTRFQCIDVDKGVWNWKTQPNQNGPVVKPPTLQTEIKFYYLKKDNKLVPDNEQHSTSTPTTISTPTPTPKPFPSYTDRCLTKARPDIGVLPETKNKWTEHNKLSLAEKLTKAALKILDIIFWKGKEAKNCGKMMSHTVAIAMSDKEDLYLAGNLDQGFELENNKEHNKKEILDILEEDLGRTAFQSVWVLNHREWTYGGNDRSYSHAEMQIAKYAVDNNINILHLGVSKTPCCACNTVLRRALDSEGNEVNTGYKNDKYHNMFAKITDIVSARGTEQYTENDKPYWRGGRQFQRFEDDSLFPNWGGFWRHPNSDGFIGAEMELTRPTSSSLKLK